MTTGKKAAQDYLRGKINAIKNELSKSADVVAVSDIDDLNTYINDGHEAACTHLGNTVEVGFSLDYEIDDTGEKGIEYAKCRMTLFRKGANVNSKFFGFCSKASEYYQTKNVKTAKNLPKQAPFTFYAILACLVLLSPLVFAGFLVYGYVMSIINKSYDMFASTLGGVNTLWIILGINFALTLFASIFYSIKIEKFRSTKKGMGNVDVSFHSYFWIGIELITMLFAWLVFGDMGIFSYTIGYLFYPAILACVGYPIVLMFLFFSSLDSFNVETIISNANYYEQDYERLKPIEAQLRSASIEITGDLLNDIITIAQKQEVTGLKISVDRY